MQLTTVLDRKDKGKCSVDCHQSHKPLHCQQHLVVTKLKSVLEAHELAFQDCMQAGATQAHTAVDRYSIADCCSTQVGHKARRKAHPARCSAVLLSTGNISHGFGIEEVHSTRNANNSKGNANDMQQAHQPGD